MEIVLPLFYTICGLPYNTYIYTVYFIPCTILLLFYTFYLTPYIIYLIFISKSIALIILFITKLPNYLTN